MNQPPVLLTPLTVLVVDDNPAFRAVCRTVLARMNAKVAECCSGVEALRRCDEVQPDWVVMDIEMPELDGLAATRFLLAQRPQTRVVIVTQSDDPDLRTEASRVGACAYVLKKDVATLPDILLEKPVQIGSQKEQQSSFRSVPDDNLNEKK